MNQKSFKNTTLVPIDFSDTSLFALEHAAAIARVSGMKNPQVTLVHIIEGADIETVSEEDKEPEAGSRETLMIEGARTKLQKVIDDISKKDDGIRFTYLIAGGKPYRKIAMIAEEIEANSIVMGTHGAHGWQRFIGSNASKVINISPCPVVTVKERALGNAGYKNIVLPLDLTKETKQKVSWATRLAKFFGSTVHVVTVTEGDEFLSRRVKANLKQVEGVLADNGIEHTSTYLTEDSGSFPEATLNFARNSSADLIIIMTQQERTFSEVIIGSYAQRIVNSSEIPVMSINPRVDLQGIFEKLV